MDIDRNRWPAGAGRSARGLYDARNEHDSCGVACLARLDGIPLHEVIERSLLTLDHLEHRGAEGADPTTGDGAGILIQTPHDFIAARATEFGLASADELPARGRYGIAMCFLPTDADRRAAAQALIERVVGERGQEVLGWRSVPVDAAKAGESSRACAPDIRQLLIGAGDGVGDDDAFERKLYVIRRRIELDAPGEGVEVALPSFSSRTLVYKGMLSAPQLDDFFVDLRDPEMKSALAIVHSRFSTNTFPSWELAHPHRMIAHNGEINTLQGNVNWMQAREAELTSELFGDELRDCLPLIRPGTSDSAAFDHLMELLVLAGRSLPHAAMMMIPRAYEKRVDIAPELDGFYRYHSRLIEPWDGPAAVVFTDGRTLGATLDRNGLRPGRWIETSDGWVAVSSEAGSFAAPDDQVVRRGRLRPGSMFCVDLERGRVLAEAEAELEVAGRAPYGRWDDDAAIALEELPEPSPDSFPAALESDELRARQLCFGYSQEDLRVLLAPMSRDGKEPTGSMGNDVALAMLSDQSPSLFSYFKQRFAQITNPAIDPVREQVVMSLRMRLGVHAPLLAEVEEVPDNMLLERPFLTSADLARLESNTEEGLTCARIDITWPLAEGPLGMEHALARVATEVDAAIDAGAEIVILSDRAAGSGRVPIPALLATSSVHHHLVRTGARVRTSLVVESGEPREVHHFAALLGYGAEAINPYLMLDTVSELARHGELGPAIGPEDAHERVLTALGLGLLKVISKMGISTIQSYCGAQIFEAVGLDRELIERHFTGTPSTIGGVGAEGLAREAITRHGRAHPDAHGLSLPEHVEHALLPAAHEGLLPQGGIYAWRRDGERHMWDPGTVATLQRAARGNGDGARHYEDFKRLANEENAAHGLVRGLVELRPAGDPIAIERVEPAGEIVRRFCTGAMSLGALSPEAHETLALAMNRIGGRSNSGEGGEDARRFATEPNGDSRRSAIKQVASGRFGVTAHYLANADQIQIKISQGAKPGEGGQLPGHKVNEYIAELRHSTPGVELISPPPHHDIYSIEDLKQLIYDLRTGNPGATISVKLASEVGVGTVAAGCVKAGADHVVIAGHDGGTGASPLSSLQGAGIPWEIGLAETQQTLLENELRSRVVLQVDGQMRTGRDVIVAALLGADEFGFSTAPLIVTGCIMMRVCHLNTCPVGVASQDPELRRRFRGKPEHVVNYMTMVAAEIRETMAELGVERFDELIGRVELLEARPAVDHWKAAGVDLSGLLALPAELRDERHFVPTRVPEREDLDPLGLRDAARDAVAERRPLRLEREVLNFHRAIGGLLSNEVASVHGPGGLPDETITLALHGSAGQSVGAWLATGITIDLRGDANDYVGKGLSGGVISIRPPDEAPYVAEENVIIGNVALYGATAGRAFFRGRAGERFAVRNSGARAVVEGVGDHGCEYMTGGVVVVLGPTGQNFAAGMTGGVAYVHDPDGRLTERLNHGLVDLDPLDDDDRAGLRALLVEHVDRTGSAPAAEILDRGEPAIDEFIKVISRDYKRVIGERAAKAAAAAAAGSVEAIA